MTTEGGTAFGLWLKERRKALDLTQPELAQQVGCSRITLVKLEAGQRRPSKQLASRLADILGIPPSEQAAFVQFARADLPARSWLLLAPEERAAPWRKSQSPPHNLPAPATAFLGREDALAAVRQMLSRPAVRLLTLVGPPGIGKTRLALQLAQTVLPRYHDGVFFVELAPVTQSDLVVPRIAAALALRDSGPRPLLAALQDFLRDRRLLLVLDNFEQLLEAAPLATVLLEAAPGLKVLVTSRERLHLYGEHVYPVPPLDLPEAELAAEPESRLPPVERLLHYDAIRLFGERAMAARPDFVLTRDNAPLVTAICAALGGLPLAIELAAARLHDLPLETIAARLAADGHQPGAGALPLLADPARDRPARQQSLRAAIDWSHDLLDPSERMLFRRLAVFRGGCTPAAVAAVAGLGDEAGSGADAGLLSLLQKSVLTPASAMPEPGSDHPALPERIAMLEGIREYAGERLDASGEGAAVRLRHAHYYLELAETAKAQLQGTEQLPWLDRLAREHDNLRAALEWACESRDAALALRLAGSLWKFWLMRGHLGEGRRWLGRALALDASGAAGELQALRANALNVAGNLASASGDYGAASGLYAEALALRRTLGDPAAMASTLNNLALVMQVQGDHAAARRLHEESLDIKRALGDRWGIASTLGNLGALLQDQGEYAAAQRLHEESLAIRRELGDQGGVALALYNRGLALLLQGELDAAEACYAECLGLYETLGDRLGIANVLNNMGEVARARDDLAEARRLYEESLELSRGLGDLAGAANALGNLGSVLHRMGRSREAAMLLRQSLRQRHAANDQRGIAECLAGLAGLANSRGAPERAARLFGAMHRLLERTGIQLHPTDRREHDRYAAAARGALDPQAWERAFAAGRALTLEEAVAEALREPREQS
jgi:predicted ATPase/DNA-binding XRE family transcriptional regulator